jgi:hypothetical protein
VEHLVFMVKLQKSPTSHMILPRPIVSFQRWRVLLGRGGVATSGAHIYPLETLRSFLLDELEAIVWWVKNKGENIK